MSAAAQASSAKRYRAVRDGLAAPLPSAYNIAVAACDRWAIDPDRVAMVVPGDPPRAITFATFRDWSSRIANGLADLGVRRGDRVGVCLPQSPECATAHLAIQRLAAIAVPISTMSGTDALRHRLEGSAARFVVGAPDENYALLAGGVPDGVVPVLVGDGPLPEGARSWARMLADGSPDREPEPTSIDDPAILIYTSGTSGNPKGALHAQRVIPAHAEPVALAHDLYERGGNRLWSPADWAWGGGLIDCLLATWNAGRTIVAWRPRGFDPAEVVRMLTDAGVSNVFMPPTALKLIRDSEEAAPLLGDLALGSVMTGGERCGADLVAWSRERLGVTPNEVYGQTEASMILGNSATVLPPRPGSVGMPYPRCRVAVLDDDDGELGADEIGEIAVHASTPAVFLGYWDGGPPHDRPPLWHRTGDLGRVDSDGYFWHEGRRDDVILTSGYRVGPGEIEEVLLRHPAVRAVAVVGLPDERRGELVTAVLELRSDPGRDALHGELQALVREQLAPYEVPRAFREVDALPRTTNGKIQRAELRRRYGATG